MEAELGAPARGADDPLFEEGLGHLQAGEWDAAKRCFETLAERYPDDAEVRRLLDHAEANARRDKEVRIRTGPVIRVNWGRVIVRILLILLLLAVTYFTVMFVEQRIVPALRSERERQAFAALVANCQDAAKGVDMAKARTACEAVLQKDPNNGDVKALMVGIEQKEKEQSLCKEAEELLAAGKYAEALQKFTDIQLLYPGSCKANERIAALNDRQTIEGLFKQGQAAFAAGDYRQAVDAYEQVRSRSTVYEAETVGAHLYTAYLALGKDLVEQQPPQVEQLPLALDYFSRALQFRPKDVDAQGEQKLASLYLVGQQAFEGGRLDDAITPLSAVVELRPGYLHGVAAQRLYDVYLRRGDQYRDTGDVSMAYRMYDLAANVPGVDHASAINRRDSVVGSLTPTPTPTNTPTATPTATPTVYVPPGPTPTPTPVVISKERGKIVFYSAKEGQEGMWVMNPDGSQKRYLGPVTKKMQEEYDALRKKETYSPDGRFHLYSLQG